MKAKIAILVLVILTTSCSRRVCGGLSGRRCVDMQIKNQDNFIRNKSIV